VAVLEYGSSIDAPITGSGSNTGEVPSLSRLSSIAVLSSICYVLFFHGLDIGELYRTEGLRALVAQEMLQSGNWFVPKLYGEPFLTKPPGMYASIAFASLSAGRVTEWSARLPSAVAATVTVFLFYWYFGRVFGRNGGLIAALILPISFAWLDKASAAEIDMMQVAWVAASILFLLRALETDCSAIEVRPASRDSAAGAWYWWSAALLCVAGGVLTKWTAPVFFYGTAVPLLWWQSRLRLLWSRQHLVSAMLAVGICVTCLAAVIVLEGWAPFYETVRREALVHLSPQHHRGAYSWIETLVHPLKIWAANLPWSAVALLAFAPGFARQFDERGRCAVQAMHCWIWPNLLFWSLVPQHSVRHSFPLFPGISGLAAIVWIAMMRNSHQPGFRGCHALRGNPSVDAPRQGCVELLDAEHRTVRSRAECGNEDSWMKRPIGTVTRFVSGPSIMLLLVVSAWIAVRLVYVHVVVASRDLDRRPRETAERIAELVPEDQTLYLFDLKDDGLMFYFGRTVKRLSSPAIVAPGQAIFALLTQKEWNSFAPRVNAEAMEWLTDQQGAAIVLVRLRGGRSSE
jgi:hypothetical protein